MLPRTPPWSLIPQKTIKISIFIAFPRVPHAPSYFPMLPDTSENNKNIKFHRISSGSPCSLVIPHGP